MRDQDRAAPPRALNPIARGEHTLGGEHLAQDALNLQEREVPAEAVLAASSPRQPSARLLRFVDEALWAELVGVGETARGCGA